jgi:hypothetical protein
MDFWKFSQTIVWEPIVLGGSTGISPLTVIISALFWTWLWGPIVLLVGTPLAACLDCSWWLFLRPREGAAKWIRKIRESHAVYTAMEEAARNIRVASSAAAAVDTTAGNESRPVRGTVNSKQ